VRGAGGGKVVLKGVKLDHLFRGVLQRKQGEHPNFEKITAATPKTLFFLLPFVSFASFVVRSFHILNSSKK
jgi:hypothetical protein